MLAFRLVCLVYIDERSVKEPDIGGKGGEEAMQSEKVLKCLEESPEAEFILDISNLRRDEMDCSSGIKSVLLVCSGLVDR